MELCAKYFVVTAVKEVNCDISYGGLKCHTSCNGYPEEGGRCCLFCVKHRISCGRNCSLLNASLIEKPYLREWSDKYGDIESG